MKRAMLITVITLTSFVVLPDMKEVNPETPYSQLDSLRGSITSERAWWDLTYYHLSLRVDPEKKSLSGTNRLDYKVLSKQQIIQIDLQPPMQILEVTQDQEKLTFTKKGPAHFISLKKEQEIGDNNTLIISFAGKPIVAKNAPWDGGISWSKDDNGNDFVASSCQELGASAWWPCKDHMYDEVDSMLMSITVPQHLMDVSNGRLRQVDQNDDQTKTYHWFVSNPINNYGVNINVGDYVQFSEVFEGENGPLDMDYFVLRNHLAKAKKHFIDAPRTIKALEHWFGPYPFYEDGYKLVEVPYLGMEHQSSVTYGNQFKKGYLGMDRSATGWGMLWDYIIIHESGHEWFANNITDIDIADLWIHEGFTTYSEGLFVEYYYGKDAGAEYIRGLRLGIDNDETIIGDYEVNNRGSSDMYPKGANLLHTIRQIINDDDKWRHILRGLNRTFFHQTVSTKQIEDFIIEKSGMDLQPVFDQYLREKSLPLFEYVIKENQLLYRWTGVNEAFSMPLKIHLNKKKELWLTPTSEWQVSKITKGSTLQVDPDFYVAVINVMGN